MNPAQTVARFRAKRKLTQAAMAYELHVTGGAIRHWEAGRREPKLWAVYRAWKLYRSPLAGALLGDLCPEFRQAIAERR